MTITHSDQWKEFNSLADLGFEYMLVRNYLWSQTKQKYGVKIKRAGYMLFLKTNEGRVVVISERTECFWVILTWH